MEQMFSVPKIPSPIVPTGHTQYTLLDKINQKISENDTHYGKFKYDRHSNFKHGVINTLGIFENHNVFVKQIGQLALIGGMYTNRASWGSRSANEESKEESKE